jgi:hypothetical protein
MCGVIFSATERPKVAFRTPCRDTPARAYRAGTVAASKLRMRTRL